MNTNIQKKEINARNLFDWLKELCKREDAVKAYPDCLKWTNFIIPELKGYMEAKKLKMYSKIGRGEYYNIDVIGWSDIKVETNIPKSFKEKLWKLEVAVEPENNPKLWMDEVVKLRFIDCPLRVVIGYVNRNSCHDEYIEYVSNAINQIGGMDLKCGQEYLLILGNSGCQGIASNYFHYVPYLWENDKFCKQDW